jgi:hypothetical protein
MVLPSPVTIHVQMVTIAQMGEPKTAMGDNVITERQKR